MEPYHVKAIKIYLNYFLKDRVTDFENRLMNELKSKL